MINLPHPNLLPEPYMTQKKELSILIFDHFDFCKIFTLYFYCLNQKSYTDMLNQTCLYLCKVTYDLLEMHWVVEHIY